MGRNTVMALLLCLSFLVLSLLGLPMTTEARMRVAFSSSSDIDDDHYFPPPTEERSRAGWERTVRPLRRPLHVPSPEGTNGQPNPIVPAPPRPVP
uniref:Uncharacterized protein n=1 Tax=Picea sitchensis TaxID=3332 RepID=A9NWG9_PICSI|nr:unknown [Picea sitchensis]